MQRKQGKQQRKKGFTLVEVIVVLVILAILAAIMIPSMVGWINKANDKKDETTMNTLAKAATAAYTETYARYSDKLGTNSMINVSNNGPQSAEAYDQYFRNEFEDLVGDDVDLSKSYSLSIIVGNRGEVVTLTIYYTPEDKWISYTRDENGKVTIDRQS